MLAVVVGIAAVVVAVTIGIAVLGSDADEPPDTASAGGVVLPQNPSLALAEDDGRWFVANDGNVTMSDVELRDGDDVVCELGTISPGDRATCDDASGLDDPAAFGRGPQGQEVRVGD